MTVERAAEAIFENMLRSDDRNAAARAALAAIARPTREMIEAGIAALGSDDGRPPSAIAFDMWRAMHAAMLKETKE